MSANWRNPLAQVLLLAAMAAAATLSVPRGGHAVPQGCPHTGSGGDVVVIGSLAELAGQVGVGTQRRLLAAFEMTFDRAGETLNDRAKVIYCDQRRINERNAYDPDVVEILNDDKVLLEIGARPDGGDIVMTYVVIPIRYYAFEAQGARDEGYYHSLYDQDSIAEGLDRLFKDNVELRLMAALALALRHEKLADGEMDTARYRELIARSRAFFCDAVSTVAEARPTDVSRGLDEGVWRNLHDAASLGASRVFQKLLGDGDAVLRVVEFEREVRSEVSSNGALPEPGACEIR